MQENNKKASILVWSIILSLALAFIFVSISSKINLSLKQNFDIKKDLEDKQIIENNIKEIENIFKDIKKIIEEKYNNYSSLKTKISDLEEKLIKEQDKTKKDNIKKSINDELNPGSGNKEYLEKIEEIEKLLNINNNLKIFLYKNENISLKNNENKIFYIPPYSNITLDIEIGTINIEIDNKKRLIDANSPSGEELSFNSKLQINSEKYFRKIKLKNIGGYSKINIISNKYIISDKKYFKIYEIFGNKEVLRRDGFLNTN